MTTVTAEDIECRDILNDVGICFMDDMDVLEASLTKDVAYTMPAPTMMTSSHGAVAPVSPETTTRIMLPHNTFESLDLERTTERFVLPAMPKMYTSIVSPTPFPDHHCSQGSRFIAAKQSETVVLPSSKKGRKRKHSANDDTDSSDESVSGEQDEVDRR